MDAKRLMDRAETLLWTHEHISLKEANAIQLHGAISSAAMEELAPVWAEKIKARQDKRQA